MLLQNCMYGDVYKRQDFRGSTPTFTKGTSISAVNLLSSTCRRHDSDDDADFKNSQERHPRTRLPRPIVKVTQ